MRGQVITRARLRFARATDYLHLIWRDGKVRQYAFLDPPIPTASIVSVFPVGDDRFAPFDLDTGQPYTVAFEGGILRIGDETFVQVTP